MLEVFTVGGGEYLVNVFNAVAAWSGGGGYRSLLRVVMVMGLIYSLLVVAFTLNYKAWMNWFLQATAIYMCLMVPTVSIKVTDRINPSLAPATIDNVPIGLGRARELHDPGRRLADANGRDGLRDAERAQLFDQRHGLWRAPVRRDAQFRHPRCGVFDQPRGAISRTACSAT